MQSSQIIDKLMTLVIWGVAMMVLFIPCLMLIDLVEQGWSSVSWQFLLEMPRDAGRSGGIGSLMISTLWILLVCLIAAVPLGLTCAIYLSEYVDASSVMGKKIVQSLDVLSGVPSIVFGLFGYSVFAVKLGLGFSILSGGLSLACMILPLFIRTCEQAFRDLPQKYRMAAMALDISHFSFILKILLPYAAPGIAVAMIISIGRALAETAVLIFTAGYVIRMPSSVMDSGRALSVHIYDLAMNVPGGGQNAAATALVLILLLIMVNVGTRHLAIYWKNRQAG